MKVRTLYYGIVGTCVACAAMNAWAVPSEWAPVANQVAFMVGHVKAGSAPIVGIGNAEDTGDAEGIFKEVKVKAHSDSETATVDGGKEAWCVINIPVHVYAMGRDKKTREVAPARYIRKLHIDAYLLIRKPSTASSGESKGSDAASFYLLKKGMDLVDIPTKKTSFKDGSKEMGQASFSVGLFIPRSTASILTENFTEPISQLKKPGVLAGYAVVASINGEKCREFVPSGKKTSLGPGETAASQLFDKTLFGTYGHKSWWETRSLETPDVDVLCISETPFAMYYGRYYPRTAPTYGAPEKDSGSVTGSDDETDSAAGSENSTETRESTSGKRSSKEKKSDYDTAL